MFCKCVQLFYCDYSPLCKPFREVVRSFVECSGKLSGQVLQVACSRWCPQQQKDPTPHPPSCIFPFPSLHYVSFGATFSASHFSWGRQMCGGNQRLLVFKGFIQQEAINLKQNQDAVVSILTSRENTGGWGGLEGKQAFKIK